ncbi:MAG: hypothetical protein ACW99G_20455 [Candidatus Thorarchaeota archaeon]|jgi:hypothetical protein
MKRYRIVAVVSIVLMMSVFLTRLPHTHASFVLIEPNKGFSPSAATYTNKTMHFQVADPYDGYSYWTYEVVGDVNGPSDNEYYQGTDTNGDAEYFGFDEFVEHGVVSAQVIFRTSAITGTYHFQPLGYFYQKTNLESNTRWALSLDWDSTGIDLYYNTGNGDTPTSVNLVGTAPSIGINYNITLSNLGDQTFVEVQDISTSPTYPIIYSGYITTESYDATSLYAGFGQYCSGDGSINGIHDNFSIIDTTFTYSEDGTGFDRIDAYVDEVFTQTLYDVDEGFNSILEIDETVTNITLIIDCWLNSTTYGVSTIAEGRNIIRQNVTVTATNGTVVFSQANLTYISGFDYGDNVFLYQYSVELDFAPLYGNVYTVVLTYEVFG